MQSVTLMFASLFLAKVPYLLGEHSRLNHDAFVPNTLATLLWLFRLLHPLWQHQHLCCLAVLRILITIGFELAVWTILNDSLTRNHVVVKQFRQRAPTLTHP